MANILVVDDEIGIRELIGEILEDSGHRVFKASSAREARRLWSAEQLDLVLLDIWMPDGDGLSLVREWAVGGRLPVPVVMLSGHATIDSAVEATRSGAHDFLEKPVALEKLLGAVRRALHDSKAGTESRPQRGTPDVRDATEPSGSAWPRGAFDLPRGAFDLPYREAWTEFTRAYLLNAFAREDGDMAHVAERTGLERTNLYRKFKTLGLRTRIH